MEPPRGDGWTAVLAAGDLPEAKAVRAEVQGVDVFLFRSGERIYALANRCSHQGGPLHKGVVKASGPNPTVTCPVHGSIFRLTDGLVIRGPASARQAVYEARVTEDVVEVRPA
ncbi:MAG TPA: Rieske (2Fe-2S) protein [Actinomycetota bacterium]|jgi:nitrite reductase/ring-hydroxylating ferredoxin subunit